MVFVVPTPIGNLNDMTPRAIEVLNEVDLILAEDTRTSGKLLKHFGISTPQRSFHAFNEHKVIDQLVTDLVAGQKMAIISDAGTPGISDPAYLLLKACRNENIEIQTLPGATALIPALVSSGLPSDKFYFEGFLPHKKGRQTRLKFLATLPCTFILYESPYRLIKCMKELSEHCGVDRQASVSREISKLYEEHIRGTISEIIQKLEQKPKIKGELVVVVAGNS